EKTKFAGSFCVNCYLKRMKVDVPGKITIEVCKNCNRIKHARGMEKRTDEFVKKLVLKQCKGKFADAQLEIDEQSGAIRMLFLLQEGEDVVELKRSIPFEVRYTCCPECSRVSGGYFEAIVQLRGNEEKIVRVLPKLQRILERETFVSNVKELKEGVDLYVGSYKAAAEVLSLLGYNPKKSVKLSGMKDGHRVYRTTFCLRL
ncbi:MAG: NMD3-related protein, partial [Candidatus Micrarchaeota archaeon]